MIDRARSGSSAAASATRVVLVTTVMLTFISYWRAAAVVLNDLASTAYYIGGIVEHHVGPAAPWFILAVMVFSFAVRYVYMESCSMFTRGGVYRIVHEAMGSTMAKVAVSALVFDFVLTGPISAVSAGHYVYDLLCTSIGSIAGVENYVLPVSSGAFACTLALAIIGYFWHLNIKGIEESSGKALRILLITLVMVAILIVWSLITIGIRGAPLPPFEVKLQPVAMGWLSGWQVFAAFLPLACLIGFGHSLLAMSGEETLAQVYREIEAPKQRNLFRTALVIFIVSLSFTGFCSFAVVMLIPPEVRESGSENLLNMLVMYLEGPYLLRVFMTGFVVVVGALILAGAVNTSMIGSNGILNRVAEDGVLSDWFRHPHRRYGTTHRIITLVAILQVITIIVSQGHVKILGEAYAFGVVWSFTFMSVSMLILRFRRPGPRAIKVPVNLRLGRFEVPVGLACVTLILVLVALTNLLTKPVATVSGVLFTASFFAVFVVSDWYNRRAQAGAGARERKEKFILERSSELTPGILDLPEGRRRVLVPIRDPHNLHHLKKAIEEAHERETEIIAITIKVERGETSFQHIFTSDEELLFSRVVELAENAGEHLKPLVIPSNNSWFAIARTAYELHADEILLGKSERIPAEIQMEQLAVMWAMVLRPGERRSIRLRILYPDHDLSVDL